MDTHAQPQARPSTTLAARIATALRGETALVLLALSFVALHIVDDNFLQPQPGTSAGDHFVSGLVPRVVLVLGAAAYPRLRAGFRATIAITFGVFGIVAGVEGAYYAAKAGPSGDDYTGLLAIPAGIVLMGVGAVTLWRTRRTDDSLRRRYLRRFLLLIGAVAVANFVLFPLSFSYVITHLARAHVPQPELGAAHEEVSFTTSDGLRLEGWYVPSKNGAAVIVFPGRKGPQRQTRMLVRHGYGVLLFDRRGEGESDGDPNILGWAGDRDLRAAVAYLERRPDVDPGRIGGIGLSVGGEMMLEAAAESDGLKAVVSEGAGIRSIHETLAMPGPRTARKWLEAVSLHAVVTPGTAIFSNHAPPPSLKGLVARIAPRPVFFIYATHGQGGEVELNPVFYAAARQPKAIWAMEDASHTGGIEARPMEYELRVIAFFDRALLQTT